MDSTETYRYTRKQALIYGAIVAVGSLALSMILPSMLKGVFHPTFILGISLALGFAAGWTLRFFRVNTDWGLPAQIHPRFECGWDYPSCSGFNLGSADDPECVGKRIWMIQAGFREDDDDDDEDDEPDFRRYL